MLEQNQVFLSFDFGTKRIGVAVGQTITKTATALKIIHAKEGVPNWQEVAALIKEWQPAGLVVGIPMDLAGKKQQMTQRAKNFAKQLEQFNLPVYPADESLTTKEARRQLFDKGGYRALEKNPIDSLAAKIILEAWLQEY